MRGCKRISRLGVDISTVSQGLLAEGKAALECALRCGARVVDLGHAHTEGTDSIDVFLSAMKAVGLDRNKVTVSCKFGFVRQGEDSGLNTVSVGEGLSHTLCPEAAHRCMDNLKEKGILPDILMVQSPQLSSAPTEDGMTRAWEDTYPLLTTLFRYLEADFIRYGICLGTLMQGNDLVPERLVECAKQATLPSGRKGHGLSAVQMSGCVLSQTGGNAVPWMGESFHNAGVGVMLTQPLQGLTGNGIRHLVDESQASLQSHGYVQASREVLEHFTAPPPKGRDPTEEERETLQGCQFVQQLVDDMNRQLKQFTSLSHYKENLAHSILPMVNGKFEAIDDESAKLLQNFFISYGEMVKYHTSQETRRLLEATTTIPANETLQEYSLKWALSQPGVDCVLLDIRDLMREEPLCRLPPVPAELLSSLFTVDV